MKDHTHTRPSCRPVLPGDITALRANCMPDKSSAQLAKMVGHAQNVARNGRGMGVVAIWEAQIVGFGQLTLFPSAAEISDLVVGARWRRRGIGTAIVNYLTRTAYEMHAEHIEIGVAQRNTRALALYRRLDFEDHHKLKLNLGDGLETVIYLRKALRTPRD